MASFFETVNEAVKYFADNGYDSQSKVEDWLSRIKAAAIKDMIPAPTLDRILRKTLGAAYKRLIENDQIMRYHQGIEKYTITKLKPALREELDRRIMASANLIKLNRDAMIDATLRRFSGWATSIPIGGAPPGTKLQTSKEIRKSLAQLPFLERRVAIDQGHKFVANLNDIIAKDGGAIAARWNQNYTRYPREIHTERDGKVYLIKNSWAHEKGLVKPNADGYLDDKELPGFLINCRCSCIYYYALRFLPPDMITKKGADELARVQALLAQKAS